jgi:lipopolysaccharide export system permease protein
MDEEIKDLQKTANSDDVMSMTELKQYIHKNKEAGLDTLHYEVAYHAKFGFALAAFVMSFLGLPFSVSRQRSGGNFASIGICMLLAFIYWALYSSMQTLGNYGRIPPALCAWIPNISMLLLSLFFLVRLKR